MNRFLCIILSTLLVASEVTLLTSSTFDDYLRENPTTLVKFMAPWCGHCQQLAPEYEAAAEELRERNVNISLTEVDATAEKDLAEKYEVQGYPTIFLFRDGKPEPYSGGRSKQAIVDWVSSVSGPAVQWLGTTEEAQKVRAEIHGDSSQSPTGFFLITPSKDHEISTLFEFVAPNNRIRGRFYAVVDQTIKSPELIAQRPGEEAVKTSNAFQNKDRLTAWIHAETFALLTTLTPENFPLLSARSPNWVWYVANQEDYDKHAPTIRRVSRNYRADLNFVWLDLETHKGHAESGLGLKTFPSIVVGWEEKNYLYPSDITEKGLTKFIEAVKGGKIARHIKSEEIPEENNEPVKVVVGKTFSESVFQKDKDVFLKIYAPWCGHCKKLEPIWEELAQKTKSENLIIAKMDGTANEPSDGFTYNGFPTIFLIPAGEKTPILYDGKREFEDILAFLKKHATYPIKFEDVKDEL